MEALFQQVRIARRRLLTQTFLTALIWAWSVALLVAALAIAVPKLWNVPFAGETWTWSWIGGGLLAGLLFAAGWTWRHRGDTLAAALEIDRRFGLKERVSSSLALDPAAIETEAGRALLADAVRKASKINVQDRFPVALTKRSWWPLAPLTAAVALAFFVDDKQSIGQTPPPTAAQLAAQTKQIKESTDNLKKKLEERKKEANELGLKDAEELFNKIENKASELAKKGEVDRKQALVEMNNLAKELEKHREQLGNKDALKEQLGQMKDVPKGPGDKLANALKNGDMKQALNEIEKLKEEIKKGNLNEEDKDKLAGQMEKMKEKIEEMANNREKVKQELQQQLQQQKNAGNMEGAEKTQQQLDKLNQQQQQMDGLKQMANQLGQAGQSLKQGDMKNAQQSLGQVQQQMQQMQQNMNEQQLIDAALDQIGECKQCMNGQLGGEKPGQGQGEGQGKMPGNGKDGLAGQPGPPQMGQGKGDGPPGQGLGEGKGIGARPENENPAKMFDTNVRQNVGKGEAVQAGKVEGPNIKGNVRETIKEEMESAKRESSDPLSGQRLDRQQRDHVRQYFDSIREGNK